MEASTGDRLVVRSRRVGDPDREAVVLEVHGRNGAAPYKVRWNDGHESVFLPSSNCCIKQSREAGRAIVIEPHVWTVDIAFTEDEDHTRADAMLDAGADRYHGWGRARRNPVDPDRPRIGEEVAAARALENLVGQLRGAAEHDIGDFEGHTVHVQV